MQGETDAQGSLATKGPFFKIISVFCLQSVLLLVRHFQHTVSAHTNFLPSSIDIYSELALTNREYIRDIYYILFLRKIIFHVSFYLIFNTSEFLVKMLSNEAIISLPGGPK